METVEPLVLCSVATSSGRREIELNLHQPIKSFNSSRCSLLAVSVHTGWIAESHGPAVSVCDTLREIATRFHGWNVPAGIPNGCRGSVWSSGRKWTLGGGEGESGSWMVSCCLLAFLSTSFGSAVLFSKKALPIRQVTHCSPSFALPLPLSMSFFKIHNPTSSINLQKPPSPCQKALPKTSLQWCTPKTQGSPKSFSKESVSITSHTWTGYITMNTEPNGHTGF